MSAKTTTTAPVQSSPVRKTPTRVSASSGKSQAGGLTRESLATDIAAFKKAGGHIEVLGHTQFRRGPAPPVATGKAAKPASAAATAAKTAG